jgi:hypothetical protein
MNALTLVRRLSSMDCNLPSLTSSQTSMKAKGSSTPLNAEKSSISQKICVGLKQPLGTTRKKKKRLPIYVNTTI